jgi:hypothetical protein
LFVLWVFLRGVLEKVGAGCGFLRVSLWWIRGESWFGDDAYLGTKNTPLFSTLFLGVLHGMRQW